MYSFNPTKDTEVPAATPPDYGASFPGDETPLFIINTPFTKVDVAQRSQT